MFNISVEIVAYQATNDYSVGQVGIVAYRAINDCSVAQITA